MPRQIFASDQYVTLHDVIASVGDPAETDMYSPTFIGREIFATMWGLGVLSAVAALGEPPRFPFDAQLRELVAKHQADFDALWLEVQRFSCIQREVMACAMRDAPWSGVAPKFPDVDSLKMELILASPAPEQFIGTGTFDELSISHDQVRLAIINLMSRLVGALLSAHWAFCADARAGKETWETMTRGLEEVFRCLLPIVPEMSPASKSLLDLAYPVWRSSLAANAVGADAASEYRSYVVTWMAHMDRRGVERR